MTVMEITNLNRSGRKVVVFAWQFYNPGLKMQLKTLSTAFFVTSLAEPITYEAILGELDQKSSPYFSGDARIKICPKKLVLTNKTLLSLELYST